MTIIQKRHAIVFGCSGINGWALVNQLLSGYPSNGAFEKVTAVANRKFMLKDAQWPHVYGNRLQLVSGVDLLVEDDDSLQKVLSEKLSSIETVSHVYYAGKVASTTYVDFDNQN